MKNLKYDSKIFIKEPDIFNTSFTVIYRTVNFHHWQKKNIKFIFSSALSKGSPLPFEVKELKPSNRPVTGLF